MFPHEHFVVAFVPVVLYVVVRERRLPSRHLVAVVFFGSQFPDLVDKPLAHQLALIPAGRVFMHSLPTAIPVVLLVGLYAWQTDRTRLGVAFVFAHLSHIVTDFYGSLLGPDPQLPPEVLWPLLPPTPSPIIPDWAGPGEIILHTWTVFSIGVLAVSFVVLLDTERDRIVWCRERVVRTTYRLYLSYHTPR